TLTTGHSRDSYRSEIDDAAVAFFRRWLDDPAAGGELRLPPNPDLYRMTAGRSSRCLHAAVWQGEPILVSIGVATHSRCGAGRGLDREATNCLGAMERCLGWAWVEHVDNRRT